MNAILFFLACNPDQKLGVIPKPPEVVLVAPANASELRQGQGLISITGTVSDSFDDPDELDLVWTTPTGELEDRSDADGNVLFELDIDSLSPGPHRITLVATDTDELQGEDLVDLVVWGPLGAPEVMITSPESGSSFLPGTAISFTGEANDATTPSDELAFAWTSDVDGPLSGEISSEGRSVLITDLLSEGSHQISLLVTDTDDEVGTDTITVTIDPEPDPKTEPEPKDAEEGDLAFSEMMINPGIVEDEVGEWVELYNTAGYPIEIAGYTFRDDDTDYWVLEGSMVVEPGEYFVLCADMDPAINGGINCDGWFLRSTEYPGLALANGADEVVLMRPDGIEITAIRYDDEWFTSGIAIGVDPTVLGSSEVDDPSFWCPQTTILAEGREPGTPGLDNDPC